MTSRAVHATEGQEQAALFGFLTRIESRLPVVRWAFHVPNGGARHVATARRLKREGVKRGVPDIWLPVRREPFVGFVCELKVKGGRTSQEQHAWLAHLETQGWCAAICWGWQAAARELLRYLGERPEDYGL